MPHIPDEEYAWLQTKAKTADFAEQLYNDPRVSDTLKSAIKVVHPQLDIPGYDSKKYVDQRFDEQKRERDEEARKAREAEQDRDWREKRKAAQERHGFTDETMQE